MVVGTALHHWNLNVKIFLGDLPRNGFAETNAKIVHLHLQKPYVLRKQDRQSYYFETQN